MSYEIIKIEGKREAQAFFLSAESRVDTWGRKLVNNTAEYAAGRLRAHAPGGIDALVSVNQTHLDAFGALQAVAGVERDISMGTLGFSSSQGFDDLRSQTRMPGIASDPADYPVYVDQGTGIYSVGDGAPGKPIHALPGSFMRFVAADGRLVVTTTVKGQRPVLFSAKAAEDTLRHMPFLLEKAGHPLS